MEIFQKHISLNVCFCGTFTYFFFSQKVNLEWMCTCVMSFGYRCVLAKMVHSKVFWLKPVLPTCKKRPLVLFYSFMFWEQKNSVCSTSQRKSRLFGWCKACLILVQIWLLQPGDMQVFSVCQPNRARSCSGLPQTEEEICEFLSKQSIALPWGYERLRCGTFFKHDHGLITALVWQY